MRWGGLWIRQYYRIWVFCIFIAVSLGGCRTTSPDIDRPGLSGSSLFNHLPGEIEDPFNTVYSFEITEEGEFINGGVSELTSDFFSTNPFYLDYPKDGLSLPEEPPERISPFLEEKLARLPTGALTEERVIISFEDNVEIPRFAETVEGSIDRC